MQRTVKHTLNITGMIAALLIWLLKVVALLRILRADFVVKAEVVADGEGKAKDDKTMDQQEISVRAQCYACVISRLDR